MPLEKRQKKALSLSEDGGDAAVKPNSNDDTPTGGSPAAAPSKNDAPARKKLRALAGDKSCPGFCCQKGDDWVRAHAFVDNFPQAPTTTGLDAYAWVPVSNEVKSLATQVQNFGLAPWSELPPAIRESMNLWSPVAQQLWESDFDSHREALVRAWIWHYLDDNLLLFSGDVPSAEYPPCASPVWTHVRALLRELDVLRSGRPDLGQWTQERHRIQYHFWRRLTDSLVREGLGLPKFATPADLVPHFRTSLKSLVADGKTRIPDIPSDQHLPHADDVDDSSHELNDNMLSILTHTMTLQRYQHGMTGSCRLRFTPIGSDSLWGFPVDEESMRDFDPPEIPRTRPGEPLPLVQLVSDPLLVISGIDGWSYETDIKPWSKTRMVVVAPWTFGGEEAEKHTYPGFEKGWRERMAREAEEEAEEQETAERTRAGRQTTESKTKDRAKEMEEDDQSAPCIADERHKKGRKAAVRKKTVKGARGKRVARGKK